MAADAGAEPDKFQQGGQPADRPGNVLPLDRDRNQADIFQAAVQMTRMPMALSDPTQPDNPVIFVNPAFLEQTGYRQDEVVGHNCRLLQGPGTDPEAVRTIRAALDARQSMTIEIYNYRKDGRGFWNSLYFCPIFDTNGKLVHYFSSQVDITRLKEAELRQRQHSDALGTMASNVAHTVNNLMTVAVGNVNLASRHAESDVQRLRLQRAEQAARSAGRLTQQILSFARRQFLQEAAADLNTLVASVEELVIQVAGPGIKVQFNPAQRSAMAMLDADQFKRALMAVIQNAADAMPKGGAMTVSTREYRTWDAAKGRAGETWVELAVTDVGAGMAADIASRATEPFFTTKLSSTGLGLSMVQGFAEQSRGRLSMETESGAGTTVRLAFPALTDQTG